MKISELKNPPQWLLDADTLNADVDIDEYGVLRWLGGEFRGGEFWGGEFRGGAFLGGEFRGGEFWGEYLTTNPQTVYGLRWIVYVTPMQMQIGCERHSHEEWKAFRDETINNMDIDALAFWNEYKAALLALCDAQSKHRVQK